MPEIGTSGSMSGDGKRSVAAWPKRPRPSSTLPVEHPPMSALRPLSGVIQTLSSHRRMTDSDPI
jgi:hypothetical protein